MDIETLEISPGFMVCLDYPDGTDEAVKKASEVLVWLISQAIIQDGVYIQGAALTMVDQDCIQIGFYRLAGRFVREYAFPVPALLAAADRSVSMLASGCRLKDLPQEVVEKMRRQMDIYRRW